MSRTVGELCAELGWTLLCGDAQRPVAGAYACDMLSWVMARARADVAWITILNSLNVVAVAHLAEVGCVVVAENAGMTAEVLERAREKGVAIVSAPVDACRAVLALHAAGVV